MMQHLTDHQASLIHGIEDALDEPLLPPCELAHAVLIVDSLVRSGVITEAEADEILSPRRGA